MANIICMIFDTGSVARYAENSFILYPGCDPLCSRWYECDLYENDYGM